MFYKKRGKIVTKISAVPPPRPKQQSTTVFFKFEQVTSQLIGWRLSDHENRGDDVVVVVIVMKTMLLVLKY